MTRFDVGHGREWIHAADEENLGFQDVADARQHALIEQDLGDRVVRLREQAAPRLIAIERRVEEIGTERRERAVAPEVACRQELRDRHVEADGDERRGGDQHAHVARGPLPALARPVDVPAAVHPHVRVQHEIARERHQQMLSARVH